ncbi:type VI secretion system ImpA family N-terminal domain-containing protein [Vibrio fluvialis]|uniref:type VI secretion system protein TssA n=1 Tax=Vibrio fluvialis TaxID=676 RepID=UPI001EEB136D|nr:type VI secretion system ImpA family N-terminal domain-containing protein [Vibrio fluvialis]MCG6346670.1 type VI secretion system ImpA family N-terminal domain-containing protein [Vibrio fluvialis]
MFEHLLNPISDEQPSGEYLKDNRTLYRTYRNAFNVAQSSFRQLVETPDAMQDAVVVHTNAENWDALAKLCESCLTEQSKDVEIYSWFTMAQLFSASPFESLAQALHTLEQMIESFWDSLQPTLPENKRRADSDAEQLKEVAEHRVKPLLQLIGDSAESGLLYMPLQMLPLVGDIDYGRFFAAEKSGSLPQLKAVALADFSREKAEVEARILALGASKDALLALEKTLQQKCAAAGTQSINFRFVKEAVERLINAIHFLVGDQFARWPLDAAMADAETPQTLPEQTMATVHSASTESVHQPTQGQSQTASVMTQTAASVAVPVVSQDALASREQAFAELQRIADYFLATEPHSPIYLLLKRAIRWGGMSLPELLEELVGDNNAVQQRIEQLAGLESAQHQASRAAAPVASAPQITMPEAAPSVSPTSSTANGSESGLSAIEW